MPSINLFLKAARIVDPNTESEDLRDFFAVVDLILSDEDLLFTPEEEVLSVARARTATPTLN
jgi:hypothetical protein